MSENDREISFTKPISEVDSDQADSVHATREFPPDTQARVKKTNLDHDGRGE